MRRTSYYVGVTTSEPPAEGQRLEDAYTAIFTDMEKLATLTKDTKFTACHTEVEIVPGDGLLQARAVVDLDAPVVVPLDKSKLSAYFKEQLPFAIKIEKRVVTDELTGPS